MLVTIIVDGDTIDRPNDDTVHVDFEMGDKVEDIKVKLSLMYAGLDPAALDLFYGGKKWENAVDFMRLRYEQGGKIYCKKKVNSCTCAVF